MNRLIFIIATVGLSIIGGASSGAQVSPPSASPRELLIDAIKSNYPTAWSGRIEWSQGLVPDPEPMSRMISHVEFPGGRHIIGTIEFNGTPHIDECCDGDINVSLEGSLPHLMPLGDAGLVKESASLVFGFLENPTRYDVSTVDDGYLVSGLSGGWTVHFSSEGDPLTARFDDVQFQYKKYTTVAGCPWATLVVVIRGGAEESFLHAEIESQKFDSAHFDFERYIGDRGRNQEGLPIVYFGGRAMLAKDARNRVWPDNSRDWTALVLKERGEIGDGDASADPGRAGRLRNPQGYWGITLNTLFWLGMIVACVGALGIWRTRSTTTL